MRISAFYYPIQYGLMKDKRRKKINFLRNILIMKIHLCYYLSGICHCVVKFVMENIFVFTKNIEDK